jgi:hypothetical protein
VAIAGLSGIERIACYGSRSMSITARQAALAPDGLGGACQPEAGQPGWMVCQHVNYNWVNEDGGPIYRSVPTLNLYFDPATGIAPTYLAPSGTTGPAYQIRGHFMDSAALRCPPRGAGTLAYYDSWLSCAIEFVVEDLQRAP